MRQSVADPVVHRDSIKKELVTVSCGTRSFQDRYAGHTVASLRQELAGTLEIPNGATAILDGTAVAQGEETTILVGRTGSLEFVQLTGVKG